MATFLMLKGIIRYYPLQDNIGFLLFKQAYIHILPWKIAFYTHVFTIIFALLAGFTQFSPLILKDHLRLAHACRVCIQRIMKQMIRTTYESTRDTRAPAKEFLKE